MSVQHANHRAKRTRERVDRRPLVFTANRQRWLYRNMWPIVAPAALGAFLVPMVVVFVVSPPPSADVGITIVANGVFAILVLLALVSTVNARAYERSLATGHQLRWRRTEAKTANDLPPQERVVGNDTRRVRRQFIGFDNRSVNAYERRLRAFHELVLAVPAHGKVVVPNELRRKAIEERVFPRCFFGQRPDDVTNRLEALSSAIAVQLTDMGPGIEDRPSPADFVNSTTGQPIAGTEDRDRSQVVIDAESFRSEQDKADHAAGKRRRWVLIVALVVSLGIRLAIPVAENVQANQARERATERFIENLSTPADEVSRSAWSMLHGRGWTSTGVAEYAGQQVELTFLSSVANLDGVVVAVGPIDEHTVAVYQRIDSNKWQAAAILRQASAASLRPKIVATTDGFVVHREASVWLSVGPDPDTWSGETEILPGGTITHVHIHDKRIAAFIALTDGSTQVWTQGAGSGATWTPVDDTIEGGQKVIFASAIQDGSSLAFGSVVDSSGFLPTAWKLSDSEWKAVDIGTSSEDYLSSIMDAVSDADGRIAAVGNYRIGESDQPVVATFDGRRWEASELTSASVRSADELVAVEVTPTGFAILGGDHKNSPVIWSNATEKWERQPMPGENDLLVALTAVGETCIVVGQHTRTTSYGVVWEGPCHAD